MSIFIIQCATKFSFQIRLRACDTMSQPSVCAILDRSSIPQHSKARPPNHHSVHFHSAWYAADGRCLEDPGLNVNLKTATLWHISCCCNLSFHTEWKKSFMMHLFIRQFVPLCYTENSTALLQDLLRCGEMTWSKSKFYLAYKTVSFLRKVNYWHCKASLSWNEMEENMFSL